MTSRSPVVRLLSALLRLVLVGLVVGVVVAMLLQGGPIDLGAIGPPSSDGDDLGASDSKTTVEPVTEIPPERPVGGSPWGEEVLVVAIENVADPERDLTGPVSAALAYWEENVGYGDYPARFVLRPDATDPDVVVRYDASIECPAHDDAIGCAPLIDGSARVDRPVVVQIRYDPGQNRRQVRNTAIHEIGHVLGITHCEEPYWVMASSCNGPLPDAPDVEDRALAWRETTIAVYVDDSNVSGEELDETRAQVDHALAYFENGGDGAFPEEVTFVRAEDPFAADVSVVFLAESTCPEGTITCTNRWGRDYDGDGAFEYHTAGTILVEPGTDVEARGWYVGWGLANLLAPGDVPEVFEEASHRERRSEWWA